MTIIVASLFLPYQPEFKLNESEYETAELVESNLVKLNPGATDNIKGKRSASVHSSTPFINRSNRSSSVHSTKPFITSQHNDNSLAPDNNKPNTSRETSAVIENNEIDVTSEQFLENLTTNFNKSSVSGATNRVSSPILGKSPPANTASIEDFFLSKNTINPNSTPIVSTATSTIATPSSTTATTTINMNGTSATSPRTAANNWSHHPINDSFTLHTVFDTVTQQTPMPMGSKTTVVRPKSRAVPDFNSSMYDIDRIKQKEQQFHSAPAMKRVHVVPEKPAIDGPATIEEKQGGGQKNDDYTSDLETDGKEKFVVPKFGGYSNKSKAKSLRLHNSQKLFGQLPWSIVPCEKGNGALKNAINIASKEKTLTDDVYWVGTVGIPTDELPIDISNKIIKTLKNNYNCHAVISDDVTFKGAYKNFCKQILWPTLHYQIPDNPNSKAFEDHSWNYYCDLNKLFAEKIAQVYKEGDIIWIHDYHLMLVPEMVRSLLPNAKIGYFLHVSFPSSEVFRCFAHRERMLKGILGANSIGFQTTEYARHFLQTTNRLLMADVSNDELKYQGKIISITSIPVGIDAFALKDHLRRDQVTQWRRLIRERWKGKKLIVCRDQFDRIRGLNKKMLAYERFLRENPKYIDKVVLVQICLGKSHNEDFERQLMLTVDRINSLSANIGMSPPVVFLHQGLEYPQYLALNCEADLFMVNTFREGMNLTCHEFIISSEEKNAPLLLSEFTGSASVLDEGSILINPWDIRHVSQSIKAGLEMTYAEKRKHWKSLVKSVVMHDSDTWIKSSLQDINNSWETNKERSTIFNLGYDTLYKDYENSKKKLFIFKITEPPTSRVLSTLSELAANNIVFVMNSHSKVTLERLYARASNVGLIAENGAYVKLDGSWYNIVEQVDWKDEVMKILDAKIERLPGAYYKVTDSMIRFHTENAEDQDRVAGVIGEAISHINTLFDENNIHAYVYKDILFVQQNGLSLSAFKFLLNYFNSSAARASGDSQCHIQFACISGSSSPIIEPLFKCIKEEVLNGNLKYGHTIVYGNTTSTNAKEHVDGLNELLTILEKVSQK